MRVLEEGLEAAALSVRSTAGAIFIGQSVDSLRCVAACGPDAKFLLERRVPLNPELAERALGQSSVERNPVLEQKLRVGATCRNAAKRLQALANED